MSRRLSVFFFLLPVIILSVFHPAEGAEKLAYYLSMPEPQTHYYVVKMEVHADGTDRLDLKMPVWTPGSYLVREYQRNVEAFAARDEAGRMLEFEKSDKNTWRIRSADKNKILVSYKVYAFKKSVRTSFLDDEHGFVNPTDVFMYVDGMVDEPLSLKIEPYSDWKTVSTGLRDFEKGKWHYDVPGYNVLADSPVEIGNHDVISFEAAGIMHEIAFFGGGEYDRTRLAGDFRKIIEAETAIFGENPNKYYLFIVHASASGGGGIEHANSCVLGVDRWFYLSEKRYSSFLGLVAHEYFHLWLGKRIRPESFEVYDYDVENYTRLLWVIEGFTSYYDELIMHRAGFTDDEAYLKGLMKNLDRLENQPGTRIQPVAMASFDAWIKYYRKDENFQNSGVSYYTKGAVLGALLDLEIMHRTGGKKRMDDVLSTLYNDFYKNGDQGFSEDELMAVFRTVGKTDPDDFFASYIHGVEEVDYQRYFDYAGIKLLPARPGRQKVWFGFHFREDDGSLVVSRIVRDTPAYRSGVSVGDELLSLDGNRVRNNAAVQLLMEHMNPGQEVEFLISRDGRIKSYKISPEFDNRVAYDFEMIKNKSKLQDEVYRAWLGEE